MMTGVFMSIVTITAYKANTPLLDSTGYIFLKATAGTRPLTTLDKKMMKDATTLLTGSVGRNRTVMSSKVRE